MRRLRPLPEIARSRAVDVEHLASLENIAIDAIARGEPPEDVEEITRLVAEDWAFQAMCRRSGPLDAIAAGFSWNEELRNDARPDWPVRARRDGVLTPDDDVVDIMEATRRMSTGEAVGTVSVAAWRGASGCLGQMAGLINPPTANASAGTSASGSTEGGEKEGSRSAPRSRRQADAASGQPDLFG